MEFLAKCDFCNTIFVQSGKFSFQLSYQTFSIRLKTVVIKRHTNQTTGWIPLSNIWFKIMLELRVHILGTFEKLEYKSIVDFQVSVNCGITNSHKIHFPGLKWTDRCSFSQMGHKNDLLEPTQCIPKPLDCDKHARKI